MGLVVFKDQAILTFFDFILKIGAAATIFGVITPGNPIVWLPKVKVAISPSRNNILGNHTK